METDQDSQLQAEILAKYLSGEMSEAESRAFEEGISVSEEKKISVEKMKSLWTAMERKKDIKSPRTREAWDKLYGRLQDEQLIPSREVAKRKISFPVFIRIAAMVLILLGLSMVIYWSMNRKPAIEMVQLNTGHTENTLIKTLGDGSVIYIAQNSLFSYPREFDPGSRNVELKGEAFFDISPNPDKPFIIETGEATIQVLGTAFNVKTNPGKGFELCVDRGKVKVTLNKDPSHSEMVTAGEKISTIHNNLVKSKCLVNEATPWYKQRMHFKDETLRNIISVLNRNFSATFALADDEIGKHKLTVTFQNETAETMTGLICAALNLKSQTINGSVVFSENKNGAKQN
ncbi:MAG: FecR domain-containing protein [Bacteroidales bacterium]|nr:FecR domain-containing protein [Bacteroidales bacterium]